MNSFILVVAALFSVACAADLDGRIIGGAEAVNGQFPYLISLREYGVHKCGGSIINAQWVLTAVLCVKGRIMTSMSVAAGSTTIVLGGDIYRVDHYIIHNDYNSNTLVNDIALVKVSSPIIFGTNVKPISLETDDVHAGVDVMLAGWGLTSFPGLIPNELQFLALKTIALDECKKFLANEAFPVVSTHLCTLTKRGEGVCRGDFGGPLVHEGKVAGVASWGGSCATGVPDVYTRISAYIDWINDNIV